MNIDSIDIAFSKAEDDTYDLAIDPATGDFSTVSGLESALALSVFAERRASSTDMAPPALRRGWVGNLVGPHAVDGFEIGSKLWLIEQERADARSVNAAKDYLRIALRWLVDAGIVQHIDVNGRNDKGAIALSAKITSLESVTETILFDLVRNTINGPAATEL